MLTCAVKYGCGLRISRVKVVVVIEGAVVVAVVLSSNSPCTAIQGNSVRNETPKILL